MRKSSRLSAGFFVLVGLLVAPAFATMQDKPHMGQGQDSHVMLGAGDVKWGPGPDSLPAGGQMAVIDGDPGGTGLYTIRAKFPDGYTVPPHWHPKTEHVTVLSGTLLAALGDKLDPAALRPVGPGGYVRMPAKANHFARAQGDTIIQITGMGPFEVTYVNPDDNPRKKTSAAK